MRHYHSKKSFLKANIFNFQGQNFFLFSGEAFFLRFRVPNFSPIIIAYKLFQTKGPDLSLTFIEAERINCVPVNGEHNLIEILFEVDQQFEEKKKIVSLSNNFFLNNLEFDTIK